MNPALFLTLSFLLFAFTTTYLPLSFSQQNGQQILDAAEFPIYPGGRYYIRPATINGASEGGGLTLVQLGNSSCPVIVLQDFSIIIKGLRVRLIPGISSGGFIFIGTPIDIAFEAKPDCSTSSSWVVVVDDFPGKYVGIGDATKDHPGKKIITGSGNYKIQKANIGYYLVFCSNIRVPSTCYNITRHDDKLGNRLVLTNGEPYKFEFVSEATKW